MSKAHEWWAESEKAALSVAHAARRELQEKNQKLEEANCLSVLSLVPGLWSMIASGWSRVPGPWSLVAGRWSLVLEFVQKPCQKKKQMEAACPWSLVPGACSVCEQSVRSNLKTFYIVL